jgi:hypothetical protein
MNFIVNVLPKGGTLKPNLFDFCIFPYTIYFSSNPLGELCYIHLSCTAVSTHCEVYQELL